MRVCSLASYGAPGPPSNFPRSSEPGMGPNAALPGACPARARRSGVPAADGPGMGALRRSDGKCRRERSRRRDQEVDLHGDEMMPAEGRPPDVVGETVGCDGTALRENPRLFPARVRTHASADPRRVSLIGDDEHGWGRNDVFSFEGGCHAKAIRAVGEAEPEDGAFTCPTTAAPRTSSSTSVASLHRQRREREQDGRRPSMSRTRRPQAAAT